LGDVPAKRRRNLRIAQWASILALCGIVLNRLNVSMIAYKWYAPVRYTPTWMEVTVTLAVILAEVWVFRWIVCRMPVLDAERWRVKRAGHAGRLAA